ncbi:MAG TPA: hypothetical protein VEI03_07215 [Stellaceae bacterium]|nr:hypothetical protein [Stellaceae bacterium]
MPAPAWVTEIGVSGTLLIAITAIWGEWIRSKFFRPSLDVELLSQTGEKIPLNLDGRQVPGRFFHLRVRNRKRPFPVAHSVQVVIAKVQSPDVSGQPMTDFAGMVPVSWRHPQVHPLNLDIGPERHADLFYISADGELVFTPLIVVTNFPLRHKGNVHVWVTAIARGTECDSEPITLEIQWDGQFPVADSDVARHLRITPVRSN